MNTSPATPLRTTAEVLIVGFGPVGKLLAVKLGRQGHTVVVVDRNEAGYPLPRAVTHCSDVARILQSVGLAPDTIPHITEPYDDMYCWRNGDGQTLVEVDWSGRGESGWYNTYFFNQPDLEDAFDRIIAGLETVRVLRGWEAIALSQRSDDATVVIRCGATGEQRSVTADWVIGADGANSRIRGWAGMDWHDDGYFFDWLVVDVKPRPGSEFPHVARQSCDVRRPSTMVPGGPGRRRWEFMRLPYETPAELNRAEKAWELLAPYGLTPGNADLERHSVYTFQSCWATEWRKGRVVLAGDAAHLMPPFAGQGLGAGLRDAMNLAWKLDAVLRGAADESLIDTYGSERIHHAVAFVRFSTSLGQVICITDPAEAAARDARMIAEWEASRKPPAPPRPGLGDGLHVGATGGMLARQGRVRVGGDDVVLFDDALGGPGAVITRTADALTAIPAAARASLRALGVNLVALSGPAGACAVVDDVDGTYRAWFDELGADTVLIRPDFHLYGSSSAAGTADLVDGFLSRIGCRARTSV
ncbi:bifunctional 3-(3-hydroxy-phenyl)propionate/3-hydroxycinnamic acid hydroxylase [Nocardia sp. CDC186]|uniref:Bifunctional 3-(3-hydroxy-phenyl)propionate/3-hydroxycinnamic acid hydroxylase n=1 Tax=Nocardia implantans TaxID=3108168 RepID=A0ABU6AXI7_9NOCA|nr:MULTISPECIES: bifunctional 3-(3-hydroxy-phenyl)propionate/3-hydroxycinnamic acid hydroxylase [unclassified Nocardia]MBF6193642.1 bifunctional 3-(3-hydroxy-phenyl)propionate/3-hydroxycinnamic acid hydroxylase [Nocardia beijingensis]MEA3529620.1 bifunctional 3-(3-hydroxy-phenyl)propionate/3-hydroxycinnamic acid hydroxylase [Nocardia sp. CDC192]MEB3512206.1 bifunctional 3-(3-hydroxy-phenyl)propionate/3-hydroxycinnamic acid hydroxylase [Nocardia sp. CDC186]